MGFIRNLLHFLTLGIVDSDEKLERKKEEEVRLNTPCNFDNGISKETFVSLVNEVLKPFKRLRVWVEGTKVKCEVRSMSGNSFWWFIIDFNDYGSITGNYWWLRCDNYDSKIPDNFASELSYQIKCFLNNLQNQKDEYEEENKETNENKETIFKCAKCGADLTFQKDFYPMTWEYYECYGCGEIFYNCEYSCAKCGAILNYQNGFHPQNDMHRCTECGHKIYAGDIYSGEKFENTYWYCDKCNALLNKQKGFNDSCGLWHCSECGHKNEISEDKIVD